MIKKILISIGVLFSFFLMFLFGFDNINILAYSDIGNALGSYPVKLDIANYDDVNVGTIESVLVKPNGINIDINSNNDLVHIYGSSSNSGGIEFNPIVNLKPNTEYTIKIFNQVGTINTLIYLWDYTNVVSYNGVYLNSLNGSFRFTTPSNVSNNVRFNIYYNTSLGYLDISFNIMLIEGREIPTYYSSPFKFGYNVNYSLAVNNLSSNQVNAGIAITDSNGNYLKTGNCVIPAGSSTICNNLNDPLYLPFNIDNNGYISFNYSLGLFIGPVGLLSVTSNDSGFNLVPVFNAYYNGSPTNNLYFKDRYTFNNLFLSGFNVSVNSSTLSKVTFPRNQVDSEFSMNTNNIVNFATDKKIETGIYNYINYTDFINSSPSDIYSFVITTGVSSPGFFENRIYTISFSNLSLKVNGDTGNVSPLPNNPNTINKYNECSAWYDIPCQLGNGLTYVIYEAPIISPVLTFIVSFITMFSSLVSFVDLFRSFGIVFGCFIIYMFINLLHKYSK